MTPGRSRPLIPLALLPVLALALAAPAVGQDPLGGAAQRDSTPSDPAALGFLRGTVDQRLYSLGGAGAKQVQLIGQVKMEVPGQPSRSFQYECLMDFATFEIQVQFIGDDEHVPAEQLLAQTFAEYALTAPPSMCYRNRVVRLSRDGDEIRLQSRPRVEGEFLPSTEWFSKDGLPLRRRVLKSIGDEQIQEETTVELAPIGAGLHLLRREVTTAPGLPRKTTTLEYIEQDGYQVLRRITIASDAAKVTGDFRLRLEPARAPGTEGS